MIAARRWTEARAAAASTRPALRLDAGAGMTGAVAMLEG